MLEIKNTVTMPRFSVVCGVILRDGGSKNSQSLGFFSDPASSDSILALSLLPQLDA